MAQLIAAMRWVARRRDRELADTADLAAHIGRWEAATAEPDALHQVILCEVYGATPEELGFQMSAPQPLAADSLADELVGRLQIAQTVDTRLIETLSRATDDIRLRDRRVGAAAVEHEMRSHLDKVGELLRFGTFRSGRSGLAVVMADASTLAGWQNIDAGNLRQAWEHFEDGKAAAREAGHDALLAFATAEQAYVLLDLNRPEQALDLMRQAHEVAPRRLPARMRSWLYAAEAEARAALGDEWGSLKAMDVAASMLPSGDGDPELPFLSLNLAHLARWRGNCLARLGDRAAIEDLNEALTGMDGAYNRAAASLRCDLAAAHLARGEPVAAREHLIQARRLIKAVGSVRQRRRFEQLSAQLAE